MNADLRRRAVLAVPAAVPVSMAAVFWTARRTLPERWAWRTGFLVYWLGWCGAFPLWVLRPRRVVALFRSGRRLRAAELPLVLLPVAGAVASELLPHRRWVDGRVASVMVATAAVNAVGEEILWRGTFLAAYPDDLGRGALWPLVGFAAWHLAPQVVRPSARGRAAFLLGSAVVGATSTIAVRRTGGLRAALLPHLLTDACGVRAAHTWLGGVLAFPRS